MMPSQCIAPLSVFQTAAGIRKQFIFVFTCLLLLNGCAVQKGVIELRENSYPLFVDDIPPKSLLTALDRQLHYLQTVPPDKAVRIGSHDLSYGRIVNSLKTFKAIVELAPEPLELNRIIGENFTVYEAEGRDMPDRQVLVTGYYEPLFHGSLNKKEPFVYPLYDVPDSLVIRKNKKTGSSTIGRTDEDGTLMPYWTREEIESNDLAHGHELVYLRDPLDAYLMHVQGSGRIQLQDGSTRSIGFAASNGLNYNSLGKLFVDENIMPLEDVNIPQIRRFFKTHPEEIQRMLHHNPRYIFFKWSDNKGPRGSLGEVLTPGRSIAIDQAVLPVFAIGYLVSRMPVLDQSGNIAYWKPLRRFVLPQDSGSAIKGAGRVDMFWGHGEYAEVAASHMRENGKLYFLIQNDFELVEKIR